jgi:cysteine desulfurase
MAHRVLLHYAQLSERDYFVIFTSGASEANNMVFKAFNEYDPNLIVVTTQYEHATSMKCLSRLSNVTYIAPDMHGHINVSDVNTSITTSNTLVSIMAVNNEIGSINNINKEDLLPCIYHADCAQAFGKYTLPSADLYSISFHKLYGFPGIGALIVKREYLKIFQTCPHIAGSQNFNCRGGTENIPLIASTIGAMHETFTNRIQKNIQLYDNVNYILFLLNQRYIISPYDKYYNQPDTITGDIDPYDIVLISSDSINTLLISIVKFGPLTNRICNRKIQQKMLDKKIIISIGSACGSLKENNSHVLTAINAPFVIRSGVIRISLGDYNTKSDCRKFVNALTQTMSELQ